MEPLVLASEISGLPRLHALLKVDNLVVPFSFPYIAPQNYNRASFRARPRRALSISESGRQNRARHSAEISPNETEKTEGIAAGQEPYFE